jgi:hypothetical protein
MEIIRQLHKEAQSQIKKLDSASHEKLFRENSKNNIKADPADTAGIQIYSERLH